MADVDDETRQYLRILAESTKNSGTAGVARRLFKAADTGSHSDYQQAETIFDRYRLIKEWRLRSLQKRKHDWLRKIRSSKTANVPMIWIGILLVVFVFLVALIFRLRKRD